MQNHVTSLELSKKISKEGWKKPTEFWWNHNTYTDEWSLSDINKTNWACNDAETKYYEVIPAPLATELLEELPSWLNNNGFLQMWKPTHHWRVEYENKDKKYPQISEEYLPNALAKMWLHLKQEGLLCKTK